MEHKQFIEELQSRLGKDKKEIDNLFSDMLQILKDRCGQMDTLSIQGFGTFEPRKKMERVSVNPATGKRMLIPPKIVLGFKPGTVIKNRLKDISGDEQSNNYARFGGSSCSKGQMYQERCRTLFKGVLWVGI